MSTASFQQRTGQPHGGARRRGAGGAAPAASAAFPRYLTSGKVTVTRRLRADAAESAAGEAASTLDGAAGRSADRVRWCHGRLVCGIAHRRVQDRRCQTVGRRALAPATASMRERCVCMRDGRAHALADGLGANAVTIGNDVFFANGR